MTLAEMQRDFVLRRKGSAALPITGVIVYAAAALLSLVVEPRWHNAVLAACFWAILPIGAAIAKLRGETVSADNPLFRLSVNARIMALSTWAVLLPIWAYAPALFPLGFGILFALHWLIFTWSVGHPWIGFWHLGLRIALTLAAWHLFPTNRMGAVAAGVALAYLLSLPPLYAHWRRVREGAAAGAGSGDRTRITSLEG